MPTFSNKRRVRHSAADMFDLVADVEHYPEFVPMCKAMKVRQRTAAGEGQESGTEIVVADMTVSFKLVREKEYLQGPFSHMQNRWTFRPLDDRSCEVEFFIDYEFRSRTLGMLMGGMFDVAFRRFAAAFEARADQVYGRKTA